MKSARADAFDFGAAESSKSEEILYEFPLFEPHGWAKRSGIQPKTIDSEVPKV